MEESCLIVASVGKPILATIEAARLVVKKLGQLQSQDLKSLHASLSAILG